jgi:hypothetical protein
MLAAGWDTVRWRRSIPDWRAAVNRFAAVAIEDVPVSAIALFYVVPRDRLPDVTAAAQPQPRGWFRPARDPFWGVLRGSSRELPGFDWSGWVFNTFDLYLESRHGFMTDNFGDAGLSAQLTKARGSHWLVLPAEKAAELRDVLESIEFDNAELIAFVASEHGPDDAELGAQAVQAALAKLKEWLPEVSTGSVGLLSIG